MEIARQTGNDISIYAAYAEGILADALFDKGLFKEAAEHYRSALKEYEGHALSTTLVIFSTCYFIYGLTVFCRGLEAVEMVGAVQLIAWTLLSMKAYDEAKGACAAALAMTEQLFGPAAIDVGASIVNLATAQMHTGSPLVETEALYSRALKIYQAALDSVDTDEKLMPDCRLAVAGIYSSLGNLYFLSGSEEKAKEAYMKVEQYYLRGFYTDIDAAAPMKNLAMLEWKQGTRECISFLASFHVGLFQLGNTKRTEVLLESAMLIVEGAKGNSFIHFKFSVLDIMLDISRR
jgi:tetratricopeptide (TPR) repeat protein